MSSKWKEVELVVSDFDGVMTDNRVLIDEAGKEFVYVSRADGQAVHILRSIGVELVIISTEINPIVQKRAEKMGVECIHGVANKADCMRKYCEARNISLRHVAYIGNDINDFDAMRLAGVKIVPNDAYEEVKSIADYMTVARGGYGVLREVAGMIKRQKAGV